MAEAGQQMAQMALAALRAIYDEASTNDQRREATAYCERVRANPVDALGVAQHLIALVRRQACTSNRTLALQSRVLRLMSAHYRSAGPDQRGAVLWAAMHPIGDRVAVAPAGF